MHPDAYRMLRRLALANVLILTIAAVHGLDMIVAFSLVVMEIEAYAP